MLYQIFVDDLAPHISLNGILAPSPSRSLLKLSATIVAQYFVIGLFGGLERR